MQYSNQEFVGEEVQLDNNEFENCTFRDVVFAYSGGDLRMTDCSLERFSFRFGGALATGLYALYQLFGTEGMLQIIRSFTDPTQGEIQLK